MRKYYVLTFLMAILFHNEMVSQSLKYGKISSSDFKKAHYEKDTSANAVVVLKKRSTRYEYNNGWELVTEVHERIHLFNKDAFDLATKKVAIYEGDSKELFAVKAYTYNLENGKVEKTKLDKDEIYKEEKNENWSYRSFTMPNLKEGSIIEWKYTINSPYNWSIPDVICQYNVPIENLFCKVQIPEYFVFNHYPSRYFPIDVIKTRTHKNYMTQSGPVSIPEFVYEIKREHIPAMVEEPYVNNINNYRAKVKFEIAAYNPPNGVSKLYNTSWEKVTKTIYESSGFGGQLKKSSHFKSDLESLLAGAPNKNEALLLIFDFVKNKIKWNNYNSKYSSAGGIKEAYKDGIGNVADINLTLTSMLRAAEINANPVLVSTRSHGIPIFPTKRGFNYVIAGVEMNGKVILLDASEKYSQPNILPRRDLNWEGRLVREDGTSRTVSLYPNTYNQKVVKLNAKMDPEGGMGGMMITTYKGLNALEYRSAFNNQKEDDLIAALETQNGNIEIDQIRIKNQEKCSKPISEMIKFTKDDAVDIIGDKIYVSPLLFLTIHENPFKLEDRLYPIDYGSPWKNQTMIQLEVPEGYTVQSKPQDISLSLPDQMGSYVLKTELRNNMIHVTSETRLNVAVIAPNYYKTIKELYKKAIENQLEKIVLIQQGP